MEKDKSLLFTLFEKFTKDKQEKEDLEEKENLTQDTDEQKNQIVKEVPAVVVEEIDNAHPVYTNVISEICVLFGYDAKYNTNIPSQERFALDKTLKPLVEKFLAKSQEEAPVDAFAYAYGAKDGLSGYIFTLPALKGGTELNMEIINKALEKAKISFGIDEDLLTKIIEKEQYCFFIQIAKGKRPIPGQDGKIFEFIKINKESSYIEDEHGRIDFKKLNLENNITKDVPIARIIYATLGVEGTDIYSNKLKAKDGKNAPPAVGKGTYLSNDKNVILAEIDGRLSYFNNKYVVENVFKLSGNVDNSTGNIDFVGDVVIMGDIKAGFEVRANGSVYVKGTAEDCIIIAGNEIVVEEGINADSSGKLEAGGNITCKFIENCTVICGGRIKTNALINSTVFSDDSVEVTGGKGTILNSRITAFNSVIANVIGNESGRVSKIVLGKSHKVSEEFAFLKESIAQSTQTIDKLSKNIKFLETQNELPTEKQTLLNQLKEQLLLYTSYLEESNERKLELESETRDYSRCKVVANIVHPSCRIDINNYTYRVDQIMQKVSFRLLDDAINVSFVS